MSDRFCGEIEIGGTIRRQDIQALADAIAAEGVSLDWGDGSVGVEEIKELIEEAAKKGETLTFRDDQAAYGEFTELEELCQKLKVAYKRSSEAKYDYDGELVLFLPGRMKNPCTMNATQDGEPTVALSVLQEYHTRKKTLAQVIKELAEAEAKVPPVKIVDNAGFAKN